MVDVSEVGEFGRRQLILRSEEPPVARLLAQALETGGQKLAVLGRDRPQRHPRAVAQGDRPASRSGQHLAQRTWAKTLRTRLVAAEEQRERLDRSRSAPGGRRFADHRKP